MTWGPQYIAKKTYNTHLELRDDKHFLAAVAVKGAGAIEPGAALAALLSHGACVVANVLLPGAR